MLALLFLCPSRDAMVCCAPAADIATRSSLHHQREEVSQICVAFSQDLALKLSHSSSLCSLKPGVPGSITIQAVLGSVAKESFSGIVILCGFL